MELQKSFENEGANLLAHSDGCTVWQFRNETGDGTMTAYDVFPGGGGGSTENRHRLSDTHTQPAGALLSRSAQSKPGIAV